MDLSDFNRLVAGMYPSDEEEDTADSSAVQNNQEPVQETDPSLDFNDEDLSAIPVQETDPSLDFNDEDLSAIFSEYDGTKSFDEIMNWQISETSCLHKKDSTDPEPVYSPFFDVLVTNSDCLRIPYEVAEVHFPASSPIYMSSFSEQTIQLSDHLNRHWHSIGYVCFDSEKAFILTRNWVQYACLINLQLMDTVRFMIPNPRFDDYHIIFMTRPFPRRGSKPVLIWPPVFLPINRLFEVEFGQGDARLKIGRLVIEAYQVKEHFPEIRTELKQEMVKLTDYVGKNWFLKIVYTGIGDKYILMDDQWEGFVREHKPVVGDLVAFYKPLIPSHDKHFLIKIEKKSDRVSDYNLTTKIQEEQFKCSPSDEKLSLTMPENKIWELCLSEADVRFGRLLMPGDKIPFLFLNRGIVKLTDEKNKDWFMIITKVKEGYMIVDGLEGYVKEFELEAGDMVTISSPACADHNKKILINCEKKANGQ